MTNRTMAAMIIRGTGEGIDVIINGIVKKEIERQNEKKISEVAYSQTIEESRNRLLADKLDKTKRVLYSRPSFYKRFCKCAVNIWALVIGTVIVWSEVIGLWSYKKQWY